MKRTESDQHKSAQRQRRDTRKAAKIARDIARKHARMFAVFAKG